MNVDNVLFGFVPKHAPVETDAFWKKYHIKNPPLILSYPQLNIFQHASAKGHTLRIAWSKLMIETKITYTYRYWIFH